MYYRDCNLDTTHISKYQKNQILLEKGFTDVSGFAEGLATNLRYAIASNKAVNMAQVNPDVAKYRFHLIASPSHYKVLDIYKIGTQTQILLLHFDKKFEAIFSGTNSNIEENVVGMGRASFDKKTQLQPNDIMNEPEWRKRTQFPIGMSDKGDFFLTSVDETQQQTTDTTPTTTSKTSNNTSKTAEKTSFWKKLFGK